MKVLSFVSNRCKYFDMHKQVVPYTEAWSWQKSIVARRQTLAQKDEDNSDMLLVLQHPPVYTLGTGSSEEHLNFDIQDSPYDVYRTERGGEVTYHGPGQVSPFTEIISFTFCVCSCIIYVFHISINLWLK